MEPTAPISSPLAPARLHGPSLFLFLSSGPSLGQTPGQGSSGCFTPGAGWGEGEHIQVVSLPPTEFPLPQSFPPFFSSCPCSSFCFLFPLWFHSSFSSPYSLIPLSLFLPSLFCLSISPLFPLILFLFVSLCLCPFVCSLSLFLPLSLSLCLFPFLSSFFSLPPPPHLFPPPPSSAPPCSPSAANSGRLYSLN